MHFRGFVQEHGKSHVGMVFSGGCELCVPAFVNMKLRECDDVISSLRMACTALL